MVTGNRLTLCLLTLDSFSLVSFSQLSIPLYCLSHYKLPPGFPCVCTYLLPAQPERYFPKCKSSHVNPLLANRKLFTLDLKIKFRLLSMLRKVYCDMASRECLSVRTKEEAYKYWELCLSEVVSEIFLGDRTGVIYKRRCVEKWLVSNLKG